MTETDTATPAPTPAETAKRLIAALDRATLATSLDGWPYASLTLAATAPDGTPLLFLSNLAQHTANLKKDSRVSLLFDGTAGLADPLTGARVTVLGRAEPVKDESLLARYVERHPSAGFYATFPDFNLYRIAVERAHLVAGFGRIDWIEGRDLAGPP